MIVLLQGGPFDGATVETTTTAINCEGIGVPEGYCAKYSATRDRQVFAYRGMAKIIVRLPLPTGHESAAFTSDR